MEQYKNKIIFFTDIDDTLIQSSRKIGNKIINDNKIYFNDIEYLVAGYNKKNQPHSYIKKSLYDFINILLKSKKDIIFIPTTARNLGSFNRSIFANNNDINISIINFGAEILYKNKRNLFYFDLEYRNLINNKFNSLNLSLKELLYKVKNEFKDGELIDGFEIRIIENTYISIKYNKLHQNDLLNEKIKKILNNLINHEYILHHSDTSFSLLPYFINKKTAVSFLIEKLNPSLTFAAGDNLNDLDFMSLTDMLIIPNNNTQNINKLLKNI
jgi:hydroxymethylpyrimidine pyrophosphatase-like HAD family hydrolase